MFCNCWNQKHQLFYFYFQNIFALQNCIHKSLKNQSPVTVPQSRVRRPTASLTCVCQVVSFCPTSHLLTLLLIYFFFQNCVCVPSRFFFVQLLICFFLICSRVCVPSLFFLSSFPFSSFGRYRILCFQCILASFDDFAIDHWLTSKNFLCSGEGSYEVWNMWEGQNSYENWYMLEIWHFAFWWNDWTWLTASRKWRL